MKAHLLIFDSDSIALKRKIQVVDNVSETINWHVVFDNTICVASRSGAKALASQVNVILPDIRYLISEVQAEKGGRMKRSILTVMNAPSPARRGPA